MARLRIAILASHGGTNAQAVLDACRSGRIDGVPCLVISNNSTAPVLDRARQDGVPDRHLSGATHPDLADLDAAILAALQEHGADVVVLAGYMKKLGPQTLACFRRRIINVHPALLPAHGGQGMFGRHVHEAVLAAGDTVTGATIHFVDEEYDRGDVIAQREVAVLHDDDVDTLAARVLAAEHDVLVETLARIASGDVAIGEP